MAEEKLDTSIAVFMKLKMEWSCQCAHSSRSGKMKRKPSKSFAWIMWEKQETHKETEQQSLAAVSWCTARDTPQCNHLVEGGFATLHGHEKSMMIEANVPPSWKEACCVTKGIPNCHWSQQLDTNWRGWHCKNQSRTLRRKTASTFEPSKKMGRRWCGKSEDNDDSKDGGERHCVHVCGICSTACRRLFQNAEPGNQLDIGNTRRATVEQNAFQEQRKTVWSKRPMMIQTTEQRRMAWTIQMPANTAMCPYPPIQ